MRSVIFVVLLVGVDDVLAHHIEHERIHIPVQGFVIKKKFGLRKTGKTMDYFRRLVVAAHHSSKNECFSDKSRRAKSYQVAQILAIGSCLRCAIR